jgi:hypothetical protein
VRMRREPAIRLGFRTYPVPASDLRVGLACRAESGLYFPSELFSGPRRRNARQIGQRFSPVSRKGNTMRWIACCVLAGIVGLGVSTMLVKHLVSKPSDPNLAELGLASSLDELSAPEEPEPVRRSSEMDSRPWVTERTVEKYVYGEAQAHSGPIMPPTPPIDQGLKQASFIDTAGAAELENIGRQWMPLCPEPDSELARSSSRRESATTMDRMPRCDEPRPGLLPLKRP